jgi:hypothetical protein
MIRRRGLPRSFLTRVAVKEGQTLRELSIDRQMETRDRALRDWPRVLPLLEPQMESGDEVWT